MRPEPLKEATQGGGIVACVSGVGIYVSSYTQWVGCLVKAIDEAIGQRSRVGVGWWSAPSKQLRVFS